MTDEEVVTELVGIVTSEPFIRQSVAIDEVASRLNVGKSRVHRLLCSTDSIKRITSFTPYTLVTVEYADEHMTDKHAIAELQKVVDNSPFVGKSAAADSVAKKLRMCKVRVRSLVDNIDGIKQVQRGDYSCLVNAVTPYPEDQIKMNYKSDGYRVYWYAWTRCIQERATVAPLADNRWIVAATQSNGKPGTCPYGGMFDSDDGVDLKVSEIYTIDEVDDGVSQDAIARELLIKAINHAASSDTVIVEGANNDDWIAHTLKTHMGETMWLHRDAQDISVNSLVRPPHRQNRMARPHRHEQSNANYAGFLTRMFEALRKG